MAPVNLLDGPRGEAAGDGDVHRDGGEHCLGESTSTSSVEEARLPSRYTADDRVNQALLVGPLQPDHRERSAQVAARERGDQAGEHLPLDQRR